MRIQNWQQPKNKSSVPLTRLAGLFMIFSTCSAPFGSQNQLQTEQTDKRRLFSSHNSKLILFNKGSHNFMPSAILAKQTARHWSFLVSVSVSCARSTGRQNNFRFQSYFRSTVLAYLCIRLCMRLGQARDIVINDVHIYGINLGFSKVLWIGDG